MLVTFGICFKEHFDTRYLVFYNPSPPRMFLSLDLLSEYRIQHGAIGPLYVTSSYSIWIFCRGVSGFATDCPCDVWCRGLTTCLLHVGPHFGNRFLNISWAVGLTYWIVYLIIVHIFFHMQSYMSWYIISFFWLYLYFLIILNFFKYSCTNIFHRRSLCTFYYMASNTHVDRLSEALVKDETVIGLFLDLSNAFDTVYHEIIVCKLEHYGIRSCLLDLFNYYLHNICQCVTYCNTSYQHTSIKYGVPQGSTLGPLLFVTYINDLPHARPLFSMLFADTNIFDSSKDINDLIANINTELW